MKVGTDGVLLGAWARLEGAPHRLLDIGTGTGVIALMLAQRAPQAQITGIDIISVEEARHNADTSPWADRLHFEQCAVQQFEATPFDVILSNPPFFVEALTSPDPGRAAARHAVELPFEALRDAVVRLLAPEGHFSLVLPTNEAERFVQLCKEFLAVRRSTEVRTTPRHPAKRRLLEMVHWNARPAAVEHESLTIGTGEHEAYTAQYRTLTRDFYLKF